MLLSIPKVAFAREREKVKNLGFAQVREKVIEKERERERKRVESFACFYIEMLSNAGRDQRHIYTIEENGHAR